MIFQRRTQPSSCEEVVLRVRGHSGQGFFGSSGPATGFGMISICVTLRAPCRWAVPIQSLPVSPPPITKTSFPLAFTNWSFLNSIPASTRFCCASISNAKYTPFSSRPVIFKSRASGVPVAMTYASKPSGNCCMLIVCPQWNTIPSFSSTAMRRSMTTLLSLKLGMP